MGLSNLFMEDAPLIEQALLPTEVETLSLLVSGPIPPAPAELLDSRRMSNLLKQLQDQADMVIIDSPPALAVADAGILGSRCSGAVLVIDSGKARTEMARRAVEVLRQANVNVVGVVLNKLQPRRGQGYYYHKYNYNYSSKQTKSPSGPKVA
jgi:capsular exopolysaccharide synthesis family protein